MTKLDDIVDPALLAEMIAGGYIKRQIHPTLPLSILNYTDAALWDSKWNDATRKCRGLIVDDRDGSVHARAFDKFFNSEQGEADSIDRDEPVVVTDKADGSLAVLFRADSEWAIATRGSFASLQAIHATAVWQERYSDVEPPAGWTLLFEIVYPENRIVIDYGETDDLILLGAVETATGLSVPPEKARAISGWPGPVVETMPYASLSEALSAPRRDNAEGLVVHALNSGARIKIKYAEYVRLHRLLTGLTARRLWEYMAAKAVAPTVVLGKKESGPVDYMVRRLRMSPDRAQEVLDAPDDWMEGLIQRVPEEFEVWVRCRVAEIDAGVKQDRDDIGAAYASLRDRFPDVEGSRRGDFVRAAQAERPDDWQLLMSMVDGKPIEASLWERRRPPAQRAFAQQSEDVA